MQLENEKNTEMGKNKKNTMVNIKKEYEKIMNSYNPSPLLESNKEMNPNVYFEPFSIYDKQQKNYTTASLNFV